MTMSSSEPQALTGSLRKRPLGGLRRVLGSKLVSALAYPHTVDHYLSLVSPLWSIHEIRAEVVEARRETSDVVTLLLRPNENFGDYKAGQYVAVTVEVDGARHTRCFSLSSTPLREDGLVTLTVKARAQGGLVSPHLLAMARPGMLLTLSAPQGDFVLPEQLPGKLLFISGGSGITPCMSMLRTLLTSGYTGQIVFVHYARSPADVIFGHELRELAARHANLQLVVETESERGSLPDLNEQSLAAIVPDFQDWDSWVCGPRPLMDACKAAFARRSAGERVRSEEFVAAQAHAAADGEAGDLVFARARKQVEGDTRTLLVQAEAAGLRPKSGCRMGICQSCICKKVSGVTRDIRSGELSSEENVEIKLCISVPMGDVTLDL